MRSPLRASIVGTVAVALALSVSSLTSAGAQASPGPASPAVPGISQHAAHLVLERIAAALKPSPAADRGARPAPYRDLTVLLLELRHAMGSMNAADHARAAGLVGGFTIPPPSSTCTGTVIVSAHFCVHYTTASILNPDGADPAWAQTTSDTLEQVYTHEVTTLGYRPPVNDGDGLLDVTLEQIGDQGYYGACAPASNAVKTEASCVLDNDFAEFAPTAPINALRVTAAHEFFHAVQFGYNSYQDRWLLEGSAVWMEDQVYPTINDYLQYVRHGGAIIDPRTPIDTDDQSQWYAATLFWKFLSESRHDPSIIKQIWNAASTYVTRPALADVVNVLSARRLSFRTEFGLFGVWNTLPPGTYVDRGLYPAPRYWAQATLSKRNRDTGWQRVVLNHLTNGSLLIRPNANLSKRARVQVSVNGPSSPTPWATVQVRLRNGHVLVYNIALNRRGDGSKVVAFNPRTVSSVVLIATNASTRGANSQTFHVRAKALHP